MSGAPIAVLVPPFARDPTCCKAHVGTLLRREGQTSPEIYPRKLSMISHRIAPLEARLLGEQPPLAGPSPRRPRRSLRSCLSADIDLDPAGSSAAKSGTLQGPSLAGNACPQPARSGGRKARRAPRPSRSNHAGGRRGGGSDPRHLSGARRRVRRRRIIKASPSMRRACSRQQQLQARGANRE